YETPQAYVNFPADVFRLYSTSITFSGANTGTYSNLLLIPPSAFSSTASTAYSFVATYLIVGMKATTTAVSPVAFISSVAQLKHIVTTHRVPTCTTADVTPASVGMVVCSHDLTISKSHAGNFSQGQTGSSYSITVSNSGAGVSSGSVTVIDSLPTGLTATGIA